MPIYEYRCEGCGETLEAMQKFSDPPLKVCPKCKSKLTRLISGAAFHLKGSGWYETDYKRNGAKSEKGTNPPDPAKKTEAKPDKPKPDKGATEKKSGEGG